VRGELFRAAAADEVVLAAGVIGTPKLLMLSGIGPASALGPHGIQVVAELPGVGENLHDHRPSSSSTARPGRCPRRRTITARRWACCAATRLWTTPTCRYSSWTSLRSTVRGRAEAGVHDRVGADAALQPRDGPADQQQPGRRSRGRPAVSQRPP
jgi:choline dehydrogenase-like flavoprotein